MSDHNHHSIREAIRKRLAAGEWPPGSLMPGEAGLAEEYQCSRTTVNRALQALAGDGFIDRKRRAGTRVKDLPTKRAQFEIPIIRHEVEATGAAYRPQVVLRKIQPAPEFVARRLHLSPGAPVLHLQTAHLGDERPFAFEDRWVNLEAAPDIVDAPLNEISANEWLLRQVPYSSGDVTFSASPAGASQAAALDVAPGDPLVTVERTTWLNKRYVTTMKLYYRPGYQMQTRL